ncbi:Start control protein cdc10 [Pleurostoma richardsiae]|uniref:Transcription factor SWI6 n=1 Tax=Pleurostoma richardsiae TaxID=41990 RepID=A0AA38RGE1_9PEZI|nr:Start control protein cdc10 [Pleurostoma richardsiae]
MAPHSQPSSQQSFTMSQPLSQPSSQQASMSAAAYRQFADASARMANDNPPQIYSAVYSGVDVYEMEVNNVAVMRRRNDSWLNATQILKVAGVDKGKRTKILEKEIQTGEHEKVQGGYGKYQGTWIKFERGVEVCRQYGVEDLLRPLLTYDMGQDGGIAGQGNVNTPTKEQAMAAQRKRMYNSSNGDNRTNGLAGTFFKNISATASQAVAAISKARFDSPGPRGRGGPSRAPSFQRQASMQSMDDFPGNSQQSYMSDGYSQNVDSAYSTQNNTQQQQPPPHMNGDAAEPPRKRQRVTMTPADSFGYNHSMEMYANAFPGSPTEPNESFIYSQAGISNVHQEPLTDGLSPLPPLPFEVSADAEKKRSFLMSLFMDSNANDPNMHDVLRSMTPMELDMPIDAQSHTALHWAATLSRMALLRALIAAGANPYRVNASGETALMRACVVTNSHDLNSFPELLDVLGGTIEVRDSKGRTVLHHIAVTSAVKGRNTASRYYLESLLEWVVRQGSAPSSQEAGANGNSAGLGAGSQAKLGLGRFMSEVVNAQDKAGDTALNIAARIGNRSIISQLLEVGADPTIANRAGLRPLDFGIGVEAAEDGPNGDMSGVEKTAPVNSQRSRESSDDIVTSISHLLAENSTAFQAELKAKQASIDSLHASLRTTSAQLGDSRRALEAAQEKAKAQRLMRQKAENLWHAREDEQYRLLQKEQRHGRMDSSATAAWEAEIDSVVNAVTAATSSGQPVPNVNLPNSNLLKARINSMRSKSEEMRQAVAGLKGRSKEVELKYRRLVALAARCSDSEVDGLLDGLVRAVESEKGELEIGRVRRFLGGVEGA